MCPPETIKQTAGNFGTAYVYVSGTSTSSASSCAGSFTLNLAGTPATLQIVATATVAAYASLGGLGRYLIDGIKVREFYLALVGALMVTVLALVLDGALAFAVWASVPGSGRLRKMPQPLLDDEVALESRARSGHRTVTTSPAGYEGGRSSPTVDG